MTASEEFYCLLGANVLAKRKHRKVSLNELARSIGVHRNTLWRWEQGDQPMPLYALLMAADRLECNHLALLPATRAHWIPKPIKHKPEIPIQFERDAALTLRERTA
jgi:transcriptional regulator with XRE-family HTH domain